MVVVVVVVNNKKTHVESTNLQVLRHLRVSARKQYNESIDIQLALKLRGRGKVSNFGKFTKIAQ